MKLIGGAAGLSRTVTWPYVILCPPIGEWVSGGEFLIYYGANAVVEKVELAQLIRDAAQNDAAGILFLVGHHYILEENLDDEIRQLADELDENENGQGNDQEIERDLDEIAVIDRHFR